MKLHEIYETKCNLYYVMDYMEGGELYMKFKDKTYYNEKDTL